MRLGVGGKAADAEVSEPDDGVVVLQGEERLLRGGGERVGEDEFPVEPVLDMVRVDDDARFVEYVGGGMDGPEGGLDGI